MPWPPAPAHPASPEEPRGYLRAQPRDELGAHCTAKGTGASSCLGSRAALSAGGPCEVSKPGQRQHIPGAWHRDVPGTGRHNFPASCLGNGSSLAPHATAVSLAARFYSHTGMLPKMEGHAFLLGFRSLAQISSHGKLMARHEQGKFKCQMKTGVAGF